MTHDFIFRMHVISQAILGIKIVRSKVSRNNPRTFAQWGKEGRGLVSGDERTCLEQMPSDRFLIRNYAFYSNMQANYRSISCVVFVTIIPDWIQVPEFIHFFCFYSWLRVVLHCKFTFQPNKTLRWWKPKNQILLQTDEAFSKRLGAVQRS